MESISNILYSLDCFTSGTKENQPFTLNELKNILNMIKLAIGLAPSTLMHEPLQYSSNTLR